MNIINLRQFHIMCSPQIVKLTKWLAEIDALTGSRKVLFCNNLVRRILESFLGHIFSVFTDRTDLETAVKQEVALTEKELLWD